MKLKIIFTVFASLVCCMMASVVWAESFCPATIMCKCKPGHYCDSPDDKKANMICNDATFNNDWSFASFSYRYITIGREERFETAYFWGGSPFTCVYTTVEIYPKHNVINLLKTKDTGMYKENQTSGYTCKTRNNAQQCPFVLN